MVSTGYLRVGMLTRGYDIVVSSVLEILRGACSRRRSAGWSSGDEGFVALICEVPKRVASNAAAESHRNRDQLAAHLQ